MPARMAVGSPTTTTRSMPACTTRTPRCSASPSWPTPEAWPAGESLRPRGLADGLIGLVVADNDPVAQRLATIQVALGTTLGVRVFPVVHRYAWPAELDLMARIAGLEREFRWADWSR